MPIDLHITGAETMDPRLLRKAAAFLVTLAEGVEDAPAKDVVFSTSLRRFMEEYGVDPSDATGVTEEEPHEAGGVVGENGPCLDPSAPSVAEFLDALKSEANEPGEAPGEGPAVAPPPPPAPSVVDATTPPPPPAPPAPATDTGVALDSEGLPWDARIHSETRKQNADGTWRVRRNTEPALVASVKAELQAAMSAPAPVPPPGPGLSIAEAKAIVAGNPPPPPPPAPGELTFPEFMRRVTGALTAGTITPAQVAEAVQAVGLPDLRVLHTRPDLVPSIAAALGLDKEAAQ